MDDPLKQVADQSINGKPGAPRFDPGQLVYTEINKRYVTFHLRTHDLAVTIEDMTTEEAGLAQLYYRDPNHPQSNENGTGKRDVLKISDNRVDTKDMPEIAVADDTDVRIQDLLNERDYEWTSGVTYGPKNQAYKWRIIFASLCLLFFFGMVGYVMIGEFVGEWPFNNDKNDAIAIATQDVSLLQFLKGKDLAVDSQAFYYDPVRKEIQDTNSKFMLVRITVYGLIEHSNGYNEIVLEKFNIIVDLENKSIISTQSSLRT